MPLAPPLLSTVDLKLARLRREALEVYAADRGIDLNPEPVCAVCGGAPVEPDDAPGTCDHPRCPSFPPAGDDTPALDDPDA